MKLGPVEREAALIVLARVTDFFFRELGRTLDFWRRRKGDQAPQKIAPKHTPRGPAMMLDDLERAVNAETLSLLLARITASRDTLAKLTRKLDTYRHLRDTDPLLSVREKAFLEIEIPATEQSIEEEAMRLKGFLDQIYGGGQRA